MKINIYFYTLILLFGLYSCGDGYLDTDYNSGVNEETTENMKGDTPDVLAEGYINGIYGFMTSWNVTANDSHDDLNYAGLLLVADLTAQNMVPNKLHHFRYDYEFDNRMASYRRTLSSWKTLYTMVNNANRVIDVFPNGPETNKGKGLIAQAYAIRALSYYHLIQLYQKSNTADPTISALPGVPMYYAKVENKENKPGRNTVSDVRSQIESDLLKAEELLANYNRPEKYYIDLSVVKGLQARYYLLVGQWEKAANAASVARTSYPIMTLVDDGFMNVSNGEWMWGFKHNAETQTSYASLFSHLSNLASGYAGLNLSAKVIDASLYSKIKEIDNRKAWFNGSAGNTNKPTAGSRQPYANVKFGNDGRWTMDFVYMRASEMILIEAEALAHLGRNDEAATVLKELMENRDPTWNATTVSVDDVYLQREIELWGEGFGYYDMKRLNKSVNRTYTGSNHVVKIDVTAGDDLWVYQIPLTEIQENDSIKPEEQND